MTRYLLPLLLALLGFNAHAQTWSYREADDGHYVYAGVGAGLALDFVCNAPSAKGLSAIEVEAHEETPVARGQIRIDIGSDLIPVVNVTQRDDVMIWLGQTGYRLPTVFWNELNSIWEVNINTTDTMIAELTRAQSFVLSAGDDVSWLFPADGFASALTQSIATCEAAWIAAQTPAANTAASAAIGSGTSPLFAHAHADIVRICEGAYSAEEGAFLQGQIDQDTTEDFVVWWNNIRCNSAFPRPLCGASHCSAKVYLSTRPTPMDLLAQSVSIQTLSNGKVGLKLVGRFDSCGINSLGCERLWFWNGTDLVETQ